MALSQLRKRMPSWKEAVFHQKIIVWKQLRRSHWRWGQICLAFWKGAIAASLFKKQLTFEESVLRALVSKKKTRPKDLLTPFLHDVTSVGSIHILAILIAVSARSKKLVFYVLQTASVLQLAFKEMSGVHGPPQDESLGSLEEKAMSMWTHDRGDALMCPFHISYALSSPFSSSQAHFRWFSASPNPTFNEGSAMASSPFLYYSFSFGQLQGKQCTKKGKLLRHPYPNAFFSTMLSLKTALGSQWEGAIDCSHLAPHKIIPCLV